MIQSVACPEMIIYSSVNCSLLSYPAVCLMQGAELPTEAVSGQPGGTGDPAGVGEWGATSADHQPGSQFFLWPVSLLCSIQLMLLTWGHITLGSH